MQEHSAKIRSMGVHILENLGNLTEIHFAKKIL